MASSDPRSLRSALHTLLGVLTQADLGDPLAALVLRFGGELQGALLAGLGDLGLRGFAALAAETPSLAQPFALQQIALTARPELQAALLLRPVATTALAFQGRTPASCLLPETLELRSLFVATSDPRRELEQLLCGADALLLERRGLLLVGRLEELAPRAAQIEHAARITLNCHTVQNTEHHVGPPPWPLLGRAGAPPCGHCNACPLGTLGSSRDPLAEQVNAAIDTFLRA